ncbi:MAG: hypothetical protein ACI4LO_03380 [Anaerovoracaceae bacterium]
MDYNELLEMLDIEDASEFQYFEHFADLMECEEHIAYDALFELISQADKKSLNEIVENYFDEIAEGLPDDSTDAFTFLKSLSMSLRGMLRPVIKEEDEDGRSLVAFVEELERFRNWYIIDSSIECTDKSTGKTEEKTFFEALILARTEKLSGEEYLYGFDQGLDFVLDDYVMSFGDALEAENDEDGYFEEDLTDPSFQYRSGLSDDEY